LKPRSRLDELIRDRTRRRRDLAIERTQRILSEASAAGLDVVLFGSLTRDDFMLHSDIDLMVLGDVTVEGMIRMEKIVAKHLRDTDINYDLVFESLVGPDEARRLLDGHFQHQLFAGICAKMARVEKEMIEIEKFIESNKIFHPSMSWAVQSTISLGLHNVYNGIEDVMRYIAKHVDGYVPVGASAHQDLLDQLATPVQGVRPALIDQDTYRLLSELKRFRQKIRNGYGHQMGIQHVMTLVNRVRIALRNFKNEIHNIERSLSLDNGHESAGFRASWGNEAE
jgi:predicted nucleotidyltransferase